MKITVFLLVSCFIGFYILKSEEFDIFKIYYNWYLFLFTLLRAYLHRRYKIIAHLLLNQIYLAMKLIKSCVVTRGLKFGDIYDAGNYSCDAINDLIKPAELKDLLKSCGADDVIIIPAGLSTITAKPAEH